MDRGLSLWLPQWRHRHDDEEEEAGAPAGATPGAPAGATAGAPAGATAGASAGGGEDIASLCALSYPARINAAKILIELEDYDVRKVETGIYC